MADDPYDTPLTPDEQAHYDTKFSPQDSADYDMQGWYQDNKEPGVGGVGFIVPEVSGHYTDQYKKPNHMTFSTESQYHGVNGEQGGEWSMQPDDTYAFRPGPSNYAHHSAQDMVDYFQRVEPNNTLVLDARAVDAQKAGDDKGRASNDPSFNELMPMLQSIRMDSSKMPVSDNIVDVRDNEHLKALGKAQILQDEALNDYLQAKDGTGDLPVKKSPEAIRQANEEWEKRIKEYNDLTTPEDQAFDDMVLEENKKFWARGEALLAREVSVSQLARDAGIETAGDKPLPPLPRRKPKH